LAEGCESDVEDMSFDSLEATRLDASSASLAQLKEWRQRRETKYPMLVSLPQYPLPSAFEGLF
jgi:hypothetical protein